MESAPISESKQRSFSAKIVGAIFGALFSLAGTFFLWMTVIAPYLCTRGSENWLPTQATIVSSELKIDRDSDGTTYRPRVEFEYTVDNHLHTSDTYDFTELNRSKIRCEQIIAACSVGEEVTCFVSPTNHDSAVIVRNFDFSWIGFLLPTIFIVIGLAIALGSIFHKEKTRKSISGFAKTTKHVHQSNLATSNSLSGDSKLIASANPADIEDSHWDVPKTLKPYQKRTTTFIITLLFTLFWNGIVSCFVYAIVKEAMDGGFALFQILFLVPFILVGLGLIVGLVYTLAAIFNPKVELALSTGAVGRGGSFDVAWQLSGRTSAVNWLKVTIEGEESATYQRGTDTLTATSIFCSMPIAEVTESQDIEFGSASATIPQDTMHTFTANRNKISWRVKVVGDISSWPNINETYEFRVKP
jgi:hypothetical protein